MADESTTKLVISIETILRNLDRTLAGLGKVEKQLKSIATIKVGAQANTAALDKAAIASAKLGLQQQKLQVQTTELANRQERARQTTERLAQSQERLAATAARTAEAQRRAAVSLLPQADAHVQAFRKVEQANKDAAASTKALNTELQSIGNGLRSLGQGASSLGFALTAALTVPLVAIGKFGLDAAVTLDSLKRGLVAITGSSEEAGRQLARLTEIAKLPGIGFEEAIQGSIRLQAVGFSAKDAEKALIEFSNAIALTGGGREELNRITVQLGQLAAKGKVLSQDLRPIIEAAPAVGRALKAAFGTVNADDIAALTTNSREFLDVLTKELEKLPRAAGGAKNAFENFRDVVFRTSSAVGEALIPILTKLAGLVEATIVPLAKAFQQLSPATQTVITLILALTAALGPALFIFGQLTTGIGRLLVGFAQLNALGILPTIKNLKLLGTAALAASEAEATLGAGAALATGGILALIALLAAGAAAFLIFSDAEKKTIEIDVAAAKAREDRVNAEKAEIGFLQSLVGQVSLTAEQQAELKKSYDNLEGPAKGRIDLIQDEEAKLRELIKTRKEALAGDTFGQQAAAAVAIGNITDALKELTAAQADAAVAQNLFNRAADIAKISLKGQQSEELRLSETERIRAQASEAKAAATERERLANEKLRGTIDVFKQLGDATDKSTDSLLGLGQQGGRTRTEIDSAKKAIDEFTKSQQQTAPAIDDATRALRDQQIELNRLGEAADKARTAREQRLKSIASQVREEATSLADARKLLDQKIKEFGVQGDVEKEKQAKSVEDLINQRLGLGGRAAERAGTSLRTAQTQLSKALIAQSQALADQQDTINKNLNDKLLRDNESNFKLQLTAYEVYLRERAALTVANIDLEINAQQKIADAQRAEQLRLLEASKQRGVKPAERVRDQAQSIEAETRAIEAETKIIDLQARQKEILLDVDRLTAESQRQQIKDIRQLEIEYGELRGAIQDSLDTAVVEKYREQLEQLGKRQVFLNGLIAAATALKKADQVVAAQQQLQINQRQIEVVRNLVRTTEATNELAVANRFIEQAKQRQSDLEKQIAFDVEFRGKTEQQAIRERLAGEEKVKNSLAITRDIIAETIKRLQDIGLTPPKGLLDFVKDVTLAMKGLGELSFTEQFRLAQEEFNRLNDERITKIADVERAVRHRDLAEIEGRILIKKLNGEYVADLERQAELLRQIADRSGQQGLKKQATDAQQTAKDVRAATDEVADFNVALKSTSIDALREGFSQFFRDLTDNTKSAKEKLLSLLDSVRNRINDFVAERLADKLIESLFGTGKEGDQGLLGGIFDKVLGIKPKEDAGIADNTTATEDNTEAINGLSKLFGGDVAGGGGIKSPKSDPLGFIKQVGGFIGSIFGGKKEGDGEEGDKSGGIVGALGKAFGFGGALGGGEAAQQGSTVIESLNIVADWLSRLVAALQENTQAVNDSSQSDTQASGLSGLAALFSGGGGEATGDIIPAAPRGRIIRVAEAGFDEAVLTTDPKHATRQVGILKEFLRRTRGLQGQFRVPEFAEGGLITARDAEANLLASLGSGRVGSPRMSDSALATVGAQSQTNLRILNLLDKRQLVGGHLRSAEGATDIMNIISENRDEIGRRIGVR